MTRKRDESHLIPHLKRSVEVVGIQLGAGVGVGVGVVLALGAGTVAAVLELC